MWQTNNMTFCRGAHQTWTKQAVNRSWGRLLFVSLSISQRAADNTTQGVYGALCRGGGFIKKWKTCLMKRRQQRYGVRSRHLVFVWNFTQLVWSLAVRCSVLSHVFLLITGSKYRRNEPDDDLTSWCMMNDFKWSSRTLSTIRRLLKCLFLCVKF